MTQASVSVVIPCFNAENTILRALESVKKQTCPVLEVICVDDCSTDNTVQVIEGFRSRNPGLSLQILRNAKNSGPGFSRNSGWDIASGDYIAFLDADDAWHPEKIAIQYSWMLDHPQVALCGHEHFLGYSQESADSSQTISNRKAYLITPNEILLSNPFTPTSAMLKRSLHHRFEPSRRYTEDYLLWMQICLDGDLVALLGLRLAYVFKGAGIQNLSRNLLKMRLGDIENYWQLWRRKKITLLKMSLLVPFSVLKFILLITFPAAHSAIKQRLFTTQLQEKA